MKNSLVLCAVAFVALAAPLAADEPPPVWSGSGELSYVSTSGNTDTQTLGLGFNVEYKPGVWTSNLKLGYIRAETDGDLTAEKITGLLGTKRSVSERFDVYGRTTFLRNKFAGIDSSWGLEAGGSYKALTGDRHFLDLSLGLGYTAEDRLTEPNRDFAMSTVGADYKWKISESTDFTNEFRYFYDFDDSDDWRISNTTALSTAINSIFSLKASYALVYLNQPAVGFEKRDSVTSIALVAKF